MYTIHVYAGNRKELYPVSSLWAGNLIAYKYVTNWGWEEAHVVDDNTGEIMKSYIKG